MGLFTEEVGYHCYKYASIASRVDSLLACIKHTLGEELTSVVDNDSISYSQSMARTAWTRILRGKIRSSYVIMAGACTCTCTKRMRICLQLASCAADPTLNLNTIKFDTNFNSEFVFI